MDGPGYFKRLTERWHGDSGRETDTKSELCDDSYSG